jgi:Tol biopolymer transport system component
MTVRGTPRELREHVSRTVMGTQVIMSPNGTLVYQMPGDGASRLVLGTTTGGVTPVGEQARAYSAPRFSPDGRRIAVAIAEAGAGGENIWVVDRGSGQATRVTQGGNAAMIDWTPDGRAIVFLRDRATLWVQPVDAGGEPRQLADSSMRIVDASMAPDGHSAVTLGSTSQLVRVSLDGSASRDTIVPPWAGLSLRPGSPRVSPDGRWVAFADRNDGQVYVRSLTGSGTVQVSDVGGAAPAWGPDSRRLYYRTSAGVVETELQTAPSLAVLRRRRLDALPVASTVYDVAPDGTSLLMLAPVRQGPEVRVVVNWSTDVRRTRGVREPE